MEQLLNKRKDKNVGSNLSSNDPKKQKTQLISNGSKKNDLKKSNFKNTSYNKKNVEDEEDIEDEEDEETEDQGYEIEYENNDNLDNNSTFSNSLNDNYTPTVKKTKNTSKSSKRGTQSPEQMISTDEVDNFIKTGTMNQLFIVLYRSGNSKQFTFIQYLGKILKILKSWTGLSKVILTFDKNAIFITKYISERQSVIYFKFPIDVIDPIMNTKLFYHYGFPDVSNNDTKRYDLEIDLTAFLNSIKIGNEMKTQVFAITINGEPGTDSTIHFWRIGSDNRGKIDYSANIPNDNDIATVNDIFKDGQDLLKDTVIENYLNPSNTPEDVFKCNSFKFSEAVMFIEKMCKDLLLKIWNGELYVQAFGENVNDASITTNGNSAFSLITANSESSSIVVKKDLKNFWSNEKKTHNIETLTALGNNEPPYAFTNLIIKDVLKFGTDLATKGECYIRLLRNKNQSTDDNEMAGFWFGGNFLGEPNKTQCEFAIIMAELTISNTVS